MDQVRVLLRRCAIVLTSLHFYWYLYVCVCSEARPYATRRGQWQHVAMRVLINNGLCDVQVYIDGVKAPVSEANSAAFKPCGAQGNIK